MPHEKRRSKVSKPHAPAHAQERTNLLLEKMLALQKQNTIRESPAVPDVDRIILGRHKVHTFHRSYSVGNITGSTTAEVDGAVTITLASFPDYTDFTNLFDTYRFMQVVVEFNPLFLDTTATTNYPPIATVIDYDDGNATAYAQLEEYDSFMITQTGQYFQRVFTPRIALAAYSGTFTSYSQPKAGTWIDVASTGVVHYGLKYALPETGAANSVWSVTVHAIMQFRESR
jgi:hypothetical protein